MTSSSLDLHILGNDGGTEAWLNDQLINAGQQVIQKQFPSVGGLQHPILSETLTFDIRRGPAIRPNSKTRWTCLSSIGSPTNNVKVFDSLRPSCDKLGKDVDEIIA